MFGPDRPFVGGAWIGEVRPFAVDVVCGGGMLPVTVPAALSDGDVERIAKRVAELLRDELRLRPAKNETSHGLRIGDAPIPGDVR